MVNFFNDIASEEDYLGYDPYIESFNYILQNCESLITPPFVFGIHGKWGTGKTTFMNLIQSRIKKNDKFYILDIDPWEYGKNHNFITIFLAKLYNEVGPKIENDDKKVGSNFIKAIFKPLKLSLDVSPIKVEYDFDKFSFEQQKSVIKDFISKNFEVKEAMRYILNHDVFNRKKIIVFIDDLDRCDVDRVMEVLEYIKLILNSKNCIFFLGCDINYLECALNDKYKNFIEFNRKYYAKDKNYKLDDFSREYLEKIIQIPFYMPTIDSKSVKRYVNSIIEKKNIIHKKNYHMENIYELFRKSLKDDFISELLILTNSNARRIKRILNITFLNYVFMKFKNVEKNNLEINIKLLAFISLIREVYPDFYIKNLSNEIVARNTFEKYFKIYLSDEVKDKNYLMEINNAHIQNDRNKDNNIIYDNIVPLFELFFKNRKIKDYKMLSNEIYYISLYISVSNLYVAESDNELAWGALANIKSEITGKRLYVFLNMLNENSPAKNFINWFFNEIYDECKEYMLLGIVKNVNIYLKSDDERNFLFRFSFDFKKNALYICFAWRNSFQTIIKDIDTIIVSNRYDKKSKRITIDENVKSDELEQIKDDLRNIATVINSNFLSDKEIASTDLK